MNWRLVTGGMVGLAALIFLSWFVFGRGGGDTSAPTQTFGTADTRTDVTSSNEQQTTNDPLQNQSPSTQKVFKVHDGPVAGATFVETLNPTTTIARYVLAENGRVFDLPIDSPGAVPRTISNTTIPGVMRALWAGESAVLQYVDQETVKTLALTLPAATTSSSVLGARLQFLPNNIIDITPSPDGTNIGYLLKTPSGSDLYSARADGGGARKVTSLMLSQLLMSWPTVSTLIVQTPPAFGVESMALRVNANTGSTAALLHAPSLSLSADRSLANVIYHSGGAAGSGSYMHSMTSGLDIPLSFNPLPERCVWSRIASSTVYCATAAVAVPQNYGDLLRSGEAGVPQQIVLYRSDGYTETIAVPGSADGGPMAEIVELALSLDEKYLLFVRSGDRSLWGVRLTP